MWLAHTLEPGMSWQVSALIASLHPPSQPYFGNVHIKNVLRLALRWQRVPVVTQ